MAVANWLSRVSGTLKNGREAGSWLRATSCCRRASGRWWIFHEHVSLPVDMKSGRAILDLVP
jgi:ketosteroid isomerase-like protein